MAEVTLLTDELRGAVGYQTDPVTIQVDGTVISRLVDAIEDCNPLWTDAKKPGEDRRVVQAPPSLLFTVYLRGKSALDAFEAWLPKRVLDGGAEAKFFESIQAGDTISVVNKVVDITERQGRHGPMLIITTESSWHNQRNELVASSRNSAIRY